MLLQAILSALLKYNLYISGKILLCEEVPSKHYKNSPLRRGGGGTPTGWSFTTYTQHRLVNIAKKKRELKSSQMQQFERILAHEYTIRKING